MKSPFPGMDPFLEAHWRDVHASCVIYTRDALQAELPSSLFARVEERVFIETDEGIGRNSYPDVPLIVFQPPGQSSGNALSADSESAVLDEPYIFDPLEDQVMETYLEIIDASSGNRVVTVIEILSPSNKILGPGKELYRTKQKEMIRGNVNLVEIDLIRQGERVSSFPVSKQPPHVQSLYQVCVRRAANWHHEIYPIPLPKRLPRIRIPLRATDADIRLDLQAILDQAYRNGRYFQTLNYAKPLEPALVHKEDAAFVAEILKNTTK